VFDDIEATSSFKEILNYIAGLGEEGSELVWKKDKIPDCSDIDDVIVSSS
jgi:hypothetical protein